MNSVLRNSCNIYTLGWCLYYLQGTLYTYGSIWGKLILVALLAYSMFFFLTNSKLYNTKYFRILLCIIVLFVIYTIFRYISSETFVHSGVAKGKFEMLKNVCISLFPIFCYYGYARKGYLTGSWFKYGALVFLLLSISSFYWEQSYRLAMAIEVGSSQEEFTNNTGYLFAAVIPLLALTNSQSWYKYTLLVVSFVFVLFAMKRGAILVSIVAAALFLWSNLKRSKGFNKVFILILGIAVMVVLSQAVSYLLENSDYFNYRLQQTAEGSSSGRDEMYSEMIHYFLNDSSIFVMLFGNGIDGTGILFGNGAHNDWIEFAIDMGILGLIFYFIYWVRFYKTWRSSKGLGTIYTALGIIFISELLKTFFSFSINDMPIQEMPALGYCLAAIEMQRNKSA